MYQLVRLEGFTVGIVQCTVHGTKQVVVWYFVRNNFTGQFYYNLMGYHHKKGRNTLYRKSLRVKRNVQHFHVRRLGRSI